MQGSQVTVRKLKFEYPDNFDACWTKHRPEFSCVANSISLLMPYMEPYVVKSVANYLPLLDEQAKTDSQIDLENQGNQSQAQTVRDYLAQETQHHIQHKKFNKIITRQYKRLTKLEQVTQKIFNRLQKKRSNEFNLAMAATFEAFAYSVAHWTAPNQSELFKQANPEVLRLFKWHLAEEIEHKEVVFNVWKAAQGKTWRYVAACFVSVAMLAAFVLVATTTMLVYERRIFNPISWYRLTKWAISFAFELLPNLTITALPSFHPDQLVDPISAKIWLHEAQAEPEVKLQPDLSLETSSPI